MAGRFLLSILACEQEKFYEVRKIYLGKSRASQSRPGIYMSPLYPSRFEMSYPSSCRILISDATSFLLFLALAE